MVRLLDIFLAFFFGVSLAIDNISLFTNFFRKQITFVLSGKVGKNLKEFTLIKFRTVKIERNIALLTLLIVVK